MHVVEPAGSEIFYGRTASASGGRLDLDSNAACRIDGVNNENVTWNSSTPPKGIYDVKVDYWRACGGLPANYTVTVNNCGKVDTFAGAFSAADADQGGAGAGRLVTRVDFKPCDEARAAGRITYEDFPQMATGLSSIGTQLPVRFAAVEVRRNQDDAVLATGDTDSNGNFDVSFRNDGAPGYYILALAKQDNATVRQKVVDDTGKIYAVRTSTIDESAQSQKTDIVLDILRAKGAPAFNIFDIGVVGNETIRTHTGQSPPMLTWL